MSENSVETAVLEVDLAVELPVVVVVLLFP
jgi:hypothetical protein